MHSPNGSRSSPWAVASSDAACRLPRWSRLPWFVVRVVFVTDLLQHLSRITRLRVRHTETGAPCFWEEIITGPLEYIRGPRNRLTQVLEQNQRGRPLLRHLQHALRAAPGSRPRPRGSELAAWAAAGASILHASARALNVVHCCMCTVLVCSLACNRC